MTTFEELAVNYDGIGKFPLVWRIFFNFLSTKVILIYNFYLYKIFGEKKVKHFAICTMKTGNLQMLMKFLGLTFD